MDYTCAFLSHNAHYGATCMRSTLQNHHSITNHDVQTLHWVVLHISTKHTSTLCAMSHPWYSQTFIQSSPIFFFHGCDCSMSQPVKAWLDVTYLLTKVYGTFLEICMQFALCYVLLWLYTTQFTMPLRITSPPPDKQPWEIWVSGSQISPMNDDKRSRTIRVRIHDIYMQWNTTISWPAFAVVGTFFVRKSHKDFSGNNLITLLSYWYCHFVFLFVCCWY